MTSTITTTPNLCRAAGVSYRQFDYWARHGLLGPISAPGSGLYRIVDDELVCAVVVMAYLTSEGIPPASAIAANVVAHARIYGLTGRVTYGALTVNLAAIGREFRDRAR